LVAKIAVVSGSHVLVRPHGIVVNGVQVERVAGGQGDEGVARHEWIVRPIRLVGPLQNANPFRVAHLENIRAERNVIIVHVRHPPVGVVTSVAVEVEIITEIGGRDEFVGLGTKTGARGLYQDW